MEVATLSDMGGAQDKTCGIMLVIKLRLSPKYWNHLSGLKKSQRKEWFQIQRYFLARFRILYVVHGNYPEKLGKLVWTP